MGIGSVISSIAGSHLNGRLSGRLARFRTQQDGALVIFALMLAGLMMMMGGIAVDVMRYESRRTSLQNTLDRSTLAAAALNQDQDPEAVVNADGISTAEQSISNVEIAMVPDVSGSMQGDKIIKLRAAASEFVATVLEGDDDHHVSISIVPYNAQVNLGPELREKFSATHIHDAANVNCLELPDSVFTTTMMPRDLDMPMYAFADFSYSTSKVDGFIPPNDVNFAVPNFDNSCCLQNTNNIVRLPNTNLATLQGQINGLTADGNTSIVLGLKWGEALLDPDMRDTFTLVPHLAANAASAAVGWRATPWDSGEGVIQQDWKNVWASVKLKWVAWQLYGRALGTGSTSRNSVYSATFNAMTDTWKMAPQMDTLLQQACTAARGDGIIIYGIAFQATTSGQTQIRNCSTDGAAGWHYFNATTMNIASAFQSIASNISQLRLTQ